MSYPADAKIVEAIEAAPLRHPYDRANPPWTFDGLTVDGVYLTPAACRAAWYRVKGASNTVFNFQDHTLEETIEWLKTERDESSRRLCAWLKELHAARAFIHEVSDARRHFVGALL